MEKQQYTVTNNEKEQRFEVLEDGHLGYLEYRFYKNNIAMMHTFVPDELEGRGIASALAHYALEWAREHQKPVIVYCPFVAAYLKRHPEYNELLAKD
ncbi:MAG: GNAT family N-acetyltransferase [Flavisolibacter sp.]